MSPEFAKFMRDLIEEHKPKIIKELSELNADESIIIATPQKLFNRELDHKEWELEDNRSEIRPEVLCSECRSVMALSNWTYRSWKAGGGKIRVCCLECVMKLLKEKKDAPGKG